jgi:hypothetical protein
MGKADQLASSVLQRVSILQLHYIKLQQYPKSGGSITVSSHTIYCGLHINNL